MKELGLDFEYEQNPRKDNSKALPYAEAFLKGEKEELTLTMQNVLF